MELPHRGGVVRSSVFRLVGFAVPIRHVSGDDPEKLQRGEEEPINLPKSAPPCRQPLVLNASTDGELITSRDNLHVLRQLTLSQKSFMADSPHSRMGSGGAEGLHRAATQHRVLAW